MQQIRGRPEFLASKREMLAAFDVARERAAFHQAKTSHGNVGEAQFRMWLEAFLPGKYGVTPGYIVSQDFRDASNMVHFDVVVYDRLESPVLWVNENPDHSRRGMSRAIPAEHVLAVFEVKSAFSTTTATKAMNHLNELSPLLIGHDAPNERYKRYLPARFFCSVVFFELRKQQFYAVTGVDRMADTTLRGFGGGVILRCQDRPPEDTCSIQLLSSPEPMQSSFARNKSSIANGGWGNSVMHGAQHVVSLLTWSTSNYATFAFDIVARLAGTYDPGRVSSWQGLTLTE